MACALNRSSPALLHPRLSAGEESLRRCFDYFVQVDIDYHRRFFRSLGLDDNVIKSKDSVQYEDRVHELLNVWIEKTGREASINHLLRTLLELDQRRTAEVIKEKVLESGYYRLDQNVGELSLPEGR